MKLANLTSILPRVGLALFSTLLCLFAAELALRLMAADANRKLFSSLSTTSAPVTKGDVTLGQMIRPSANPKIIYELIPSLSARFVRAPVRTNSRGFRGPEISEQAEENTIRILGIGDSTMFGYGVKEEEHFLSALARRLRASHPEKTWEIINTAVPGYNTVMELETLKDKGLSLKPDVVIIHFDGNDLHLPNFIRTEDENVWAPNTSYLWAAIQALRNREEPRHEELLKAAPRDATGKRYEYDVSRVPECYRDMVGEAAYVAAMRELAALRDEHGFALLLTTHGIYRQKYVDRICAELKIVVVDIKTATLDYMEAHGIEEYLGSELARSERDAHPSPLGHQFIADHIYDYFQSCGLLKSLGVSE